MNSTFEVRRTIEHRIIKRVIADALSDETIELSVDDDPPTRNPEALHQAVVAVDEARLYFHRQGEKAAYGWVFFVLGNDGWDVICDYTTNLGPVLAGANALADTIEANHT
jgi:hypothetical protein